MKFPKYARWSLVGIILIILPLSFIACQAATTAVPGEAAAVGEIVVTPVSGTPSAPITIAGAGFVPGERVDLLLEMGGVESLLGQRNRGFIIANEYGAFTAISTIPALAEVGVYAIEARGDKGTTAFSPLEVIEKK